MQGILAFVLFDDFFELLLGWRRCNACKNLALVLLFLFLVRLKFCNWLRRRLWFLSTLDLGCLSDRFRLCLLVRNDHFLSSWQIFDCLFCSLGLFPLSFLLLLGKSRTLKPFPSSFIFLRLLLSFARRQRDLYKHGNTLSTRLLASKYYLLFCRLRIHLGFGRTTFVRSCPFLRLFLSFNQFSLPLFLFSVKVSAFYLFSLSFLLLCFFHYTF